MAYIGARIELHRLATSTVDAIVRQDPTVEKRAVLPQMLNPWRWEAIVETNTEIEKFPTHALRGPALPSGESTHMYPSPPSEIIKQAASARSAAALLRFARFPVPLVDQLRSGYRVTFLDFRFYREQTNTALAAEVILDQSMRVVNESVSFVHRIN
jgi:hypothetical protein